MYALLGTACIAHSPIRTTDGLNPKAVTPRHCTSDFVDTSSAELQAPGADGKAHRADVECVTYERHKPVTNASSSLPHEGFDLHILEFDDEGRPWNDAALDLSLSRLRKQLDEEPALVVTFIHGWKNNAEVCNGNLCCFREVLEVLAKSEREFAGDTQKPRRVIGIYIGWRGGAISLKGLKELTFWGRKHTAHVVGDNGAVTRVIEQLREMVVITRDRQSRAGSASGAFAMTSMVTIGHSFGGALLYSAIATSLNAQVGKAMEDVAKASSAQAPRTQATQQPLIADERFVRILTTGDLFILLNPAMEASRFSNLNQVRNLRFDGKQVPIFMTLASEFDGAVGGFFPVGQAFSTLARAARSRDIWFSMEKGFGLYEPFHTHRLVLREFGEVPAPQSVSGECRCTSNLAAFGDALIMRLKPLYDLVRTPGSSLPAKAEQLELAAYRETLYTRLEPYRDVDPHNPFIMARVDPRVIGGHNDIFNPRFTDFLIEYLIQTEIKRSLSDDFGTVNPK